MEPMPEAECPDLKALSATQAVYKVLYAADCEPVMK